MAESKKINIGVNDGQEFFAHELTVNFNPTQFILDFKSVTPRNDPRSKETPYVNIRHNVVLVDVFHAKKINELLTKMVEEYEKKYGKIEMPKALKKAQKERKESKDEKSTKEAVPAYLG
ncbi:DUF3467 domain-containing protein [Candidatus Woesearchaeota archaeon]|nr:DUF3467 domain-containing protein [Candidatus Woesearchaeota archaeon]